MTWLQEQLTKMGACKAQVESTTVKMVERAMVEDADFCQKAALDVMERLAESFEDAKKNTKALCEKVDDATRKADGIISEVTDAAKREIASLHTQCEVLRKERNNLSAGIIYDKDLAEAVKAYKAVLLATKDVFGESMDVETKIAVINAGSYIAWRGMPEQKEFIKKKPL